MKRVIFLVIIALTINCCMPVHMNHVHAGSIQTVSEHADDSDYKSKQTVEHIYINYARKEKRVKIERYIRVAERIEVDRASEFHVLEFNDTGLLTEATKRDYSGEGDPAHYK